MITDRTVSHRERIRCRLRRPWWRRDGPARRVRWLGVPDRIARAQLRGARRHARHPDMAHDPDAEPQWFGVGDCVGGTLLGTVHLRSGTCRAGHETCNARSLLCGVRAAEPRRSPDAGLVRCVIPVLARGACVLAPAHSRPSAVPDGAPADPSVEVGWLVEHPRDCARLHRHGPCSEPVEHLADQLGGEHGPWHSRLPERRRLPPRVHRRSGIDCLAGCPVPQECRSGEEPDPVDRPRRGGLCHGPDVRRQHTGDPRGGCAVWLGSPGCARGFLWHHDHEISAL